MATHGVSCKWSQGRHSRHEAINHIIHFSLVSANIPSHLKPFGLSHSDGRRSDGMSMVPWTSKKLLVWDVTLLDTCAPPNTGIVVTGEERWRRSESSTRYSNIHTYTRPTCMWSFLWQSRHLVCLALNPLSSSKT